MPYLSDELGLAQMLGRWLARSGEFTHLGMVSSYPYYYEDEAVGSGPCSQGGRFARPIQQSHTNPINRPAATIPTQNRIETKPATFAPAGKTPLSSQDATSR